MDYKDISVIFVQSNTVSTLPAALRDAGFSIIINVTEKASLREAFSATLANGAAYILTLRDGDGFSVADVTQVADALLANDSTLYVGARKHSSKKSLPANIFGFLSGINANDIDSSLLGMSAAQAAMSITMKNSGKSFFLDLLLDARSNSIPIKEIQIDAPCDVPTGWSILTQSFKLYLVFIKFSISAMIAYIVDIGTFYLFEQAFAALSSEYKILVSTILSRVLCSAATYILNKGAVFKSHASTRGTVVRFLILAVAQLLASWLLVWGIGSLLGGGDLTNMALKIVVDLVIFMASFTLQRDWVFKQTSNLL